MTGLLRHKEKFIVIFFIFYALLVSLLGAKNTSNYVFLLGPIASVIIIFSDKIYQVLLFATIIIYMVLSYGVTNLGVNLGTLIIPFGEVVLILGLVRIFLNIKSGTLKELFSYKNSLFILFIFSIFLIRIPFDIQKYGAIAVRDGTHYIEMLYFLVMMHEVILMKKKDPDFAKKIYAFVMIALNCAFFYSLFYIKKDVLLKISPVISGYQRQVPIFGFFSSTHIWLLFIIMSNLYLISYKCRHNGLKLLLHFQNIIALLIILITSSRISLFTIIAFALFYLFTERKASWHLMKYIMLGLVSIMLLSSMNIKIQSIRGEVDMDFIKNAFLSSIGQGDHAEMANGYNQRKVWISKIIEDTPPLTGQGFGLAMTDFAVTDKVKVREPHNSLASIYARMGIVIVLVWLTNILLIFKKNFVKMITQKDQFSYMSISLILIALINCMGEPFFESTYNAIPFYCLIAILNFGYEKKKEQAVTN